jgi:hydroxyacylglutathione hydrolase
MHCNAYNSYHFLLACNNHTAGSSCNVCQPWLIWLAFVTLSTPMLHYETIPVTPFQQNCSVVWEDEGMTAAIDHAGGTAELAETLQLPIIGPHPGDQFWIDGLKDAAANYGFPPSRAFTPTRWLSDGDTVTLGAHTLQVRHCPGHTPGHVVFYSPEIQRAFVGDVLFAGSIGRTDFPQGNHQDLIDSITQRLWPMGNDTVFIPGHGPESTFGRERLSNPYVGGT